MTPFHWLFDKFYPLIRFVYERLQGHRWFDSVSPQIWLGGAPTYPRDYRFLLEQGVNAVVNIRAERHDDYELYKKHGIAYLQLRVPDVTVPSPETLEEGVLFIHQHVQAGGVVLVHCAKGRGRSAALLAAYLMRYRGLSYDQAKELLFERRPLVKLGDRQRRVLEAWLGQNRYRESVVGGRP